MVWSGKIMKALLGLEEAKSLSPDFSVINALRWYLPQRLPPRFPHISLRIFWNPERKRPEGFSSSAQKVFLQNESTWLLTNHSPTVITTRVFLSGELSSDDKGLHYLYMILHTDYTHTLLSRMNDLTFNMLHTSPASFSIFITCDHFKSQVN